MGNSKVSSEENNASQRFGNVPSRAQKIWMAWTAEDKAKAMVVIKNGLPLTKEALIKTLAGVHNFAATQTYCHAQRQKLDLVTSHWLPADLAKMMAVVNSGLPFTKSLVERLMAKMDAVHSFSAVMSRCQRARSVTMPSMLVKRKRKSALCS